MTQLSRRNSEFHDGSAANQKLEEFDTKTIQMEYSTNREGAKSTAYRDRPRWEEDCKLLFHSKN